MVRLGIFLFGSIILWCGFLIFWCSFFWYIIYVGFYPAFYSVENVVKEAFSCFKFYFMYFVYYFFRCNFHTYCWWVPYGFWLFLGGILCIFYILGRNFGIGNLLRILDIHFAFYGCFRWYWLHPHMFLVQICFWFRQHMA